MTFNNQLFLVISLSFLLSFPFAAQAHRSLLLDLPASASAPDSSTPSSSSSSSSSDAEAAASPSTLSTFSNVIVSSISFAPFASASPAPSPSEEQEDITGYEDALLDYLGNNVEVEFQNKITANVENIVNEIKQKTVSFIHETIEKRLADSDVNEIEKKCINVCKSDYEDLSNDVTEVLHDFSMTHNFEMVSDYLQGLDYDVQSCRNCRAEISLDYGHEFDQFDEWLTAMGTVSAAQLNTTIHA